MGLRFRVEGRGFTHLGFGLRVKVFGFREFKLSQPAFRVIGGWDMRPFAIARIHSSIPR